MTFNKEEELRWFQSKLMPHIQKKLSGSNNDVEVTKVDLNMIGSEESFMLTICYRATVHFKVNGKEDERLYVVKKTPAVPPEMYISIGFPALFHNEIFTYTTILPAIEKFTGETFVAPQHIFSETKTSSGLVVLEDFKANGWGVCSQKYNLTLDHILLAVRYLGNFHGIGFAMKTKQVETFNTLTGFLKESRFFDIELHPDFAIQISTGTKRLQLVAQKYYPEIEQSFIDKLIDLVRDSQAYGKARVQPVEPLATICHGDYLRNNLAVKYDETKNPIDVMMFDLQTMRYSSPMVDLSVILSLSAFADVRFPNFEEIFSTYCKSLQSAYEKYAGEAIPEYLECDTLRKEYIRFIPYALHIAGFFLMNLVDPQKLSSEEFLNIERTPEEIEEDGLTRGGEIVDKELAHQIYELYTWSKKYQVDFTEGFEQFLMNLRKK